MSGTLAGLYDPSNEVPYFGVTGGIAVILALLMLLIAKPVGRMMRGVR